MSERTKINRIKAVLAEVGMSQKQLAENMGRSRVTITRICSNESQPTLKGLLDIATSLDVDIRDLLIPNKSSKQAK